MMGALVADTPPAPILLDEARAFLRLGAAGEEDALLAGLLRAAADTCEAFVGRALLVRAVTETLPAATGWTRLGLAPVVAIDGVAALAGEGGAVALAPADYAIDIDAAGEGWVRLAKPVEATRLRVAYRAGLASDANGLPEALRHGIVRLAAHLYLQRDGEAGAAPPAAVTALWRPWRRLRLA